MTIFSLAAPLWCSFRLLLRFFLFITQKSSSNRKSKLAPIFFRATNFLGWPFLAEKHFRG
jgi:hypothetical protein